MSLSKLTLVLFSVIFIMSCKQDLKVVFPDGMKKEETFIIHDYEIIIYIRQRMYRLFFKFFKLMKII
jgi:hypothetical protein